MTPEERQRIVDEDMTLLRYGLPQKHGIEFGFDFRTVLGIFVKQMRTLKKLGAPRTEYLDAANQFMKQAEGTGFKISFDESVLDMPDASIPRLVDDSGPCERPITPNPGIGAVNF